MVGRRTTGGVGSLPSGINAPVPMSPCIGYLHAVLHYAYVHLTLQRFPSCLIGFPGRRPIAARRSGACEQGSRIFQGNSIEREKHYISVNRTRRGIEVFATVL